MSTATMPSTLPAVPTAATIAPAKARAPTGSPTLGATVRLFYQFASPRLLTASLLVSLGVRLAIGDWQVWDALVFASLVAWQPLNEWLIHKYVLHARPRRILGWTWDTYLARKHRAHHENPWDTPTLFVPIRTTVMVSLVMGPLFYLLMPTLALALTGVVSLFAIGCAYEWSHFLPHTAYRAKTNWMRDTIKFHRLHHFKHEDYWMGVSSNLGDRLLGTFPEPRSVPASETARSLPGVPVDAAR